MSDLFVDIIATRGDFSLQVAFEASKNQTLALLGPNGSGKSTVVDAISGILPITKGRIAFDGETWDEPDSRTFVAPQRRSAGVMFQHLGLFPALSALDNVAFGAKARKQTSPRERALETLGRLGGRHLADRSPDSLSGGEAQRVALARALVMRPGVLLLDEPLSALDVRARGAARRSLKDVLKEFEGVSVIVTHDTLEAMTLSDHVVIVEDGTITQQGAARDIRDHPRSQYAAAFAGTNLLAGRLIGRGDQTVLETRTGELTVVADSFTEGERVLATIHPSTITLSLDHGETSARNQILSRITAIDDTGNRVRVVLDGSPALVAEVTQDAALSLGLRPGLEVWAAVKATRVEVYPDG